MSSSPANADEHTGPGQIAQRLRELSILEADEEHEQHDESMVVDNSGLNRDTTVDNEVVEEIRDQRMSN